MLTVSLVIPNHCHKYKSCDKSKTLKTKQITNFQLKQFLMMGIVWLTNQVQWNESLKNYLKLLLVVVIDWSLRKAYRSILQLMGNLGCPCLCWSPCFWVGWMTSCLSFAFGPVLGCVGWADFGGCWGGGVLFCVVGGCSGSRGIWGWLWFSCGVAHCSKGFIAIFQDVFASIDKLFTLAGRMGT